MSDTNGEMSIHPTPSESANPIGAADIRPQPIAKISMEAMFEPPHAPGEAPQVTVNADFAGTTDALGCANMVAILTLRLTKFAREYAADQGMSFPAFMQMVAGAAQVIDAQMNPPRPAIITPDQAGPGPIPFDPRRLRL